MAKCIYKEYSAFVDIILTECFFSNLSSLDYVFIFVKDVLFVLKGSY